VKPRAASKPPPGAPSRTPPRSGGAASRAPQKKRTDAGAADVHREVVYLHPGQVFAASEPTAVTTILGSCVAIVLWDSALGVGGLNHYLLPLWARPSDDTLRFGNVAFERLLDELAARGIAAKRLHAKVFGGACLLAGAEKEQSLGAKNVEVARSLLAAAHIPLVAEDVGGRRGRKLIVHTDTGDAWVKLL
jgi:chemotaxis protein CheD